MNHTPVNSTKQQEQQIEVAPLTTYLSAIRIVMINTTLPANIGSAARAMHTMGLSHLFVVDPKHPLDDSSWAHAAGGDNVLSQAQIVPNLDVALQDCQLVFAASSRSRHIPRPVVTPTQAAQIAHHFITEHLLQLPTTTSTPNIAILFGREDRGLTNDELAHADYHIQIDANPDYPVLNVASAIQVIASFFYASFTQQQTQQAHTFDENDHQLQIHLRQVWDEPAATQQQMTQLQSQILMLMTQLQLIDPKNPRDLPKRLTRLLSRLQLDQKEYQLLNTITAKLKQQIHKNDK
ncbi:RNA methyltransferase [Psychrobacter sp. I-STPA6b]|uniref:RNA methyltransferase n=1 Tax=Psychrobacter sp. I-STPA6b TaxID=2585718 RepID=UPI001D0C0409|nr:RNA methyltransferase [Psychrobacter sp. I-STPA6b]